MSKQTNIQPEDFIGAIENFARKHSTSSDFDPFTLRDRNNCKS